MQRVLAEPERTGTDESPAAAAASADSMAERSLTATSHGVSLHQGTRTRFLAWRAAIKSVQFEARAVHSSYCARDAASISAWIASSIAGIAVVASASKADDLAPVSRRASTKLCDSRSRGPISTRSGTPLSSQALNLKPGL
eukprot:Amastigsp_a678881_21.p5 type:complete len:141 gc:universal Amastigsp_a678881_21:107-529(+)